jgi:hypothetical protein
MTLENDQAFLKSIDSAIIKLGELRSEEEMQSFEKGFAFSPEKLEAMKLSLWALIRERNSLIRRIQKKRKENQDVKP